MKRSRIYRHWQSALSAHASRRQVLPTSLKQELDELSAVHPLVQLAQSIQSKLEAEETGMQAFSDAVSPVSATLQRRTEILRQGERAVLQFVRSGDLLAYGFEVPRSMSSGPVLIPAEWFRAPARLDWEAGKLSSRGLELVEVRFFRAIDAEADAATADDSEVARRRVGRPPVAPDIMDAFTALLAEGRIDLGGTMSSHFPIVRAWLREHRPTAAPAPSKPSDEAIRQAISPLFKAAKHQTKKQ